MLKKSILLIDALINLILGILLLLFSDAIVITLGVPGANQHFYPNLLGAVLIGIAIALVLEYLRKPKGLVGLGLGGAVAINLCGGIVLVMWLLLGNLNLPFRGMVFLWGLAIVLVVISGAELMLHYKPKNK